MNEVLLEMFRLAFYAGLGFVAAMILRKFIGPEKDEEAK